MKEITILLYLAVTVSLVMATLLERLYGTTFVQLHIYHAAWFFLLWMLTGAAACYMLAKKKIWKRLPATLFHLSFIIILAGAAITFTTGTKGEMRLYPGSGSEAFMDAETHVPRQLPFSMTLDSFVIEHYPGTDVPSDYVSHVTIDGTKHTISMNNILTRNGYRFYQSSYGKSDGSSLLSVSHDPWGNAVTYSGYALLAISSCLLLLSKRAGFRKLLNHPALKRGMTFGTLFILCTCALHANVPLTADKATADSLARQQVLYRGRIAPFDTQARDFLKKLYGRESYKGLSAVQVVTGWHIAPREWYKEPIIKIKNKGLRKRLGASGEYISLSQLYDQNREYKLQQILSESGHDNKKSPLAKAVFETDEKAGMILMLCHGTLVKGLPEDGSIAPLGRFAVETEILYNSIPFTKTLFMANLTFGFIAFFIFIAAITGRRTKHGWNISRAALYISTAVLAANYLMRWYIGGRIPLSNGFETMLFMALSIMIISCMMERRFPFMLAGGFLLSGFTLLVAHLGEMNPQITPLMPVLSSPLLSIHVSLIMISYALFAFIMINGVVALILMRNEDNRRQAEPVTVLSRLLLYPATLLLGCGIFIGAVWANVSWGRYWAWDPKEVWALITFMIYGAAFHSGSVSRFRNARFFHIYMIAAFASVLITYFGVNYLLGGMHSYAG